MVLQDNCYAAFISKMQIHIENVTLVQAIIRHAPFVVIHFPILITRREIFNNYTSEWRLDPLSGLILMTIILILCVQYLTDASNFFTIKLQKQGNILQIFKLIFPSGRKFIFTVMGFSH